MRPNSGTLVKFESRYPINIHLSIPSQRHHQVIGVRTTANRGIISEASRDPSSIGTIYSPRFRPVSKVCPQLSQDNIYSLYHVLGTLLALVRLAEWGRAVVTRPWTASALPRLGSQGKKWLLVACEEDTIDCDRRLVGQVLFATIRTFRHWEASKVLTKYQYTTPTKRPPPMILPIKAGIKDFQM